MTVAKLKEFLKTSTATDDMEVFVRIDVAGESITYTECDFMYIDGQCSEKRLMIGGSIINDTK